MKDDARSGLRNALASILANSIEQILHPFDLIRVRLQSHDGLNKGNIVPDYKRITTAFKTIFEAEGIRGMYKGFFVTLVATNLSKFLYFGLYGYWRSLYQKDYGFNSKRATSYSALQSGFVTTAALAPMWVIKTRMILNTATVTGHMNFLYTIQQIYNQHGFKGFFRGLGVSLILSLHGVIQMTFYEYFKIALGYKPIHEGFESMIPLVSGVLSKIISLTVMYPATLVRTRIQQNQYLEDNKIPKYKNPIDVISKTWKIEGFQGFYKGYIACLLRSLPSSALFWFLFEFFNEHLPL